MRTDLPIDIKQGAEVVIDDLLFYFDRVDPDGSVTLRPPQNSNRGHYMVVGKTGYPRNMNCEEFMALFAAKRLIIREAPLSDAVRQAAREPNYTRKQILMMDATSQFRTLVLIALDKAIEQGRTTLGPGSLRSFMQYELTHNEEISNAAGAWEISPWHLQEMYRTRGRPGSRRLCDGMSKRGRARTKHKLKHPTEIAAYHLSRCDKRKRNISKRFEEYVAELSTINRSGVVDRPLLVLSGEGDWEVGPDRTNYLKPSSKYEPMSESKFRSLAKEGSSKKSYAIGTTDQAAEQRFDGGGFSDDPRHVGELCSMDDSPIEALFLVDRASMEPLGRPILTLLMCCFSRVILGWHLSWEPASSNSAMKTVLHANLPKLLPERYMKQFPDLPYLRCAPGTIKLDNLAGHHSVAFRDAMADQGIAVRYTGSRCPRDKADVERLVRTIIELLTQELAESNYDIARMRLYGFEPDKQQLCTLEELRPILTRAICYYNTSRHEGLDEEQPQLVFRRDVAGRKLGILNDAELLKDSIGDVYYDVSLWNWGVEIEGGRYGDAEAVREMIQDFNKRKKLPKGDITPLQKRVNPDDRKQLVAKVKVKIDPDDSGIAKVWNPHSEPPKFVRLRSNDKSRLGKPLWFLKREKEWKKQQADEYCSKEQEAENYADYVEKLRNLNPEDDKRLHRDLARALESPRLQKMLVGNVSVVDEGDHPFATIDGGEMPQDEGVRETEKGPQISAEPDVDSNGDAAHTLGIELAARTRKDATTKLPSGAFARSPSKRKTTPPKKSAGETPGTTPRNRKPSPKRTSTPTKVKSNASPRRRSRGSSWGEI
ncbi:hypothetical protein [Altererythrobacter sp. MTPC7]|uniref:hypothetical protein n=1 Tax=Altererythrobacter sp. MTPC7 TaxID=3056567 RepID=UPI0036F318F3